MTDTQIVLKNEQATEQLARMLAASTQAGDAFLLTGPLGAGKSVFARAFLRCFCKDDTLEVPSPTYTLVQTYQAPACAVSHFDLWRLGGPDELEELGWDDARDGVVLVEWPERLEDLTPPEALHIGFTVRADGVRTVHLHGWDDRLKGAALSASFPA
ncbi:tRNA (adenosine(37)-N6)-threonylcarbamoyltransferase complex ATPase subunit type 1 TsaE [Acetobacter cerevisiae]|uniref:tRNA threonylcarbamoyladenosine biosynthesis protein TsaE n=1 Tax=Acetobacter cerevisiae TaxID=178900 RepID=A0A149UXC0_9PROT|nr:tRNA (adenosine(37)-N6)-threonylcarbamoyltransferase complex ATPase subunit type 1 TsaE [Acetobacter cerevisiae]KXU96532.1 ATP/GTP hydrolase [Acetobacter cerevisiae]KXV72534.1 ATP/GTP hydrolase [Acetobacter cerevisiae]MCP1244940.1 tRNA (adenosine(37)-N6)-threonylcarbamoyltransferase complex ATPase subunit type 1 TsaE [Acetobacter cerevisiae]MCP1254517.1 tRNA (adenosine(37)-N6)-threonylcarbamoyltransferase complex ATPase subunit type 1 TsaE [Acetobacter cerevisiae]GBQ07273.1 ATP/GTP hydrolas